MYAARARKEIPPKSNVPAANFRCRKLRRPRRPKSRNLPVHHHNISIAGKHIKSGNELVRMSSHLIIGHKNSNTGTFIEYTSIFTARYGQTGGPISHPRSEAPRV